MKKQKIGIIMNGVTGRMGTNQHLMRSIVAIIKQGGVKLNKKKISIVPDPILVGRNPTKLKAISRKSGVKKWTTDLDAVLSDKNYSIYFDSQTTERRVAAVTKAIKAGKHIYCEKPTATSSADAYKLYALAKKAGIKHGVVQDKLWLPGLLKLKSLVDKGFFGKILSVRGEFGYWVFEGDKQPTQRPSWNYRKEDGGGIIYDMMCHWRYVLDNIIGDVQSVSCLGATHIKKRWDEKNKPYKCTADDACYSTMKLKGDIVAHFNSSWVVRVYRDELFVMQVEGTKGTAVAGLRNCLTQSLNQTPRPIWNPDIESPINFRKTWTNYQKNKKFDNAFKVQWELFLRHIAENAPFRWGLLEGAKGVQLAEDSEKSWKAKRWVDLKQLKK